MAYLYINSKGYEVKRHSYSAGSDFRFCRRKYQLGRVKGWKEKDQRSSMEFGNAIEAAIQHFHENKENSWSGVETFQRIWTKQKDNDKLVYTDADGSWDNLMTVGTELMHLYEVKFPTWGLSKLRFQLSYRKEVFPGTELAEIEYQSYIDMRAEKLMPDPAPLRSLSKRPLLVDIKTSGKPLPETPGLLSLDPQLREYAWVTGIPDVAFLWLVKTNPTSFEKGTQVFWFGSDLQPQNLDMKVIYATDIAVGIVTQTLYEKWEASAKGLKGKALEESKTSFVSGYGFLVKKEEVTKQRIQFIYTRISEQAQREAGTTIAEDIANIVAERKRDLWPADPGIRFPNNKCQMCAMLPICTGDNKLRDETLVNISNTPKTDWIDDLVR